MNRWFGALVVFCLFSTACSFASRTQTNIIAVVDWQRALEAHPRYEQLLAAKQEFAAAAGFRREQLAAAYAQIETLQRLAQLTRQGYQENAVAENAVQLAAKEAAVWSQAEQRKNVLGREIDEETAAERQRVIEQYRLPIVNLRLKLDNVRLPREERASTTEQLAALHTEHDIIWDNLLSRREYLLRTRSEVQEAEVTALLAAERETIKTVLQDVGAGLELKEGPAELAALTASLDKQVEVKQDIYLNLEEEVNAAVSTALAKVTEGRPDMLVLRSVAANIKAEDLTDKVIDEMKKR